MMNVLLITTDQQRADSIGAYGNPVCRTPHLDTFIDWGVFDVFQVPYSALERTHEQLLQKAHDAGACARAESLAETSLGRFGSYVNQGPQFDTIMFRFLVQLSAYDRDPRWWDWAKHNGDRALRNAEAGGLLLKFWDGSGTLAHQAVISHYGEIQTHTATVALFAWLAAVPRP